MITAKHVKEEIRDNMKVIEDVNSEVKSILKAIAKLIVVVLKVGLSNRLNTVKLMEKLGVDKVVPQKPATESENQA